MTRIAVVAMGEMGAGVARRLVERQGARSSPHACRACSSAEVPEGGQRAAGV